MMNGNLKKILTAGFLVLLLQGSYMELSGQEANAELLKSLVIKKFDTNRDGALTGVEKDGAISFLQGVDRNRDGKISDPERAVAIDELKLMRDPKAVKSKGSMSSVMKNAQSTSKSQTKGGAPMRRSPKIVEGVIPDIKIVGRPTAESIEKKRKNMATLQEMRDAKRRVAQEARMAAARAAAEAEGTAQKPSAAKKKRGYYDRATIIAVEGVHTTVPKGALLFVPPDLQGMIVKEPKGKLLIWPKFYEKYSKWVKTRKVSWETVKGQEPIDEDELETFAKGGKLIVAVYGINPITVLDPPPEEEKVVEDKVKGALGSDSKKKRR